MMKKTLATLASIFAFFAVTAQSSFTIEKMDTTSKSKEQLYNTTKNFIKEFWNTEDVIKNEDKEQGTILVKGVIHQTVKHYYDRKYIYSFTAKFLINERKYKIVIGKVECESVTSSVNNSCPYVEFCDGCEFPGSSITKLNKSKWKQLMNSIKAELTSVADSYGKFMKQ